MQLLDGRGREVGGPADLRRAASRARRGRLVLLVHRGQARERVPFDLD